MTKSKANLKTAGPAGPPQPQAAPASAEPNGVAAVPADVPGWLTGGMAVLDSAGVLLNANEPLARWLQTLPATLPGQPLPALLTARFPEWQAALAASFEKPDPFVRLELSASAGPVKLWFTLELVRHEGTRFLRLESMLPPPGELVEAGWLHGPWDRQAEPQLSARLLRAETQLQNLLQRWPGVIFSQRPDLSFAFISPRIQELTGLPAAQWESQTDCFWRAIHEADTESMQTRLQAARQSVQGLTSTFRLRHAQTGRVVYIWEYRQAVRSPSGLLLGYEGIWQDTTRLTIAERRLSSLAWKESVGMLTMGLTHDFTNLLAGILSLTESFELQVGPDDPSREALALIKRNTGSASQLVRRLRQLYQSAGGEMAYHNLNEVVSDLAELLRKVVPRHVQFQTAPDPRPLVIYADAFELRQVIVNLTLNAVDAMPAGGTLLLRTSAAYTLPPTEQGCGRLARLPAVCLSVQDSGTGIPLGDRASVFDPFFTTKPLTKGSGLGLYNARLFVEKHAGAISFETKDGAGTTFHVWLPVADLAAGQTVPAQPANRRQTLLVAGEDATASNRMVAFLREHGYYVVAAGSLPQAAELLHSPEYQFSAVLALVGSSRGWLAGLFDLIRRERLPLRTVLHVFGCNQDELDARFLAAADLTVSHDMGEPAFLQRLRSTLEPGATSAL